MIGDHQKIEGRRELASSVALVGAKVSVLFGLEFTDMFLGVKLEPDPVDQIKLRLEEIDVMFLVHHQVLEKVAGDIILHGMTMRCRLLVQGTRAHLGGQVAIDDFLDVLADPQGISN